MKEGGGREGEMMQGGRGRDDGDMMVEGEMMEGRREGGRGEI